MRADRGPSTQLRPRLARRATTATRTAAATATAAIAAIATATVTTAVAGAARLAATTAAVAGAARLAATTAAVAGAARLAATTAAVAGAARLAATTAAVAGAARLAATTTAVAGAATLATLAVLATPGTAAAFEHPFIGTLHTLAPVASTVPANGDVNPYGVATVPFSEGALVRGQTLVSNFNDEENEQGTGSTIVEVSPSGHVAQFAQIKASALPGPCPGGVGLTTALAVIPGGFVVVGSLPTENGEAKTAQAGCLIVLNAWGHPVETISGAPIDGPWDMTAVDQGFGTTLFVTNALDGTVAGGETATDEGTVVRLRLQDAANPLRPPRVTATSVIATGFPEETNPAALVLGPTGVGLGQEGTLYVADTVNSRIAAVPGALFRGAPAGEAGVTVAQGGYLASPLGLAIAPNGDILTTNGANGDLVETTPVGAEFQPLDTGAGEGGLFGLALTPDGRGVLFVNDANNTLEVAH